jgi:NADH-quinone oxidoreductase subunit L/multicomponent Na+:H+ antiporter subunit D
VTAALGGRGSPRADGGHEAATHASADETAAHGDDHEAATHEGHDDHHGGPPAGGWDVRGWRGAESTWFMLGPILTAASLSVLLGVVPRTAVFLRIIETVVGSLPGVMG